MTFRLLYVAILWTSIGFAQNPLPLQNGNIWQYRSTDPFNPYPFRTEVTGDTILPNAHIYFVLSGSTFGSPFLRLNNGKVYAYSFTDQLEYKLFDFLAFPGDTMVILSAGTEVIIFRSTWVDSITQRQYWEFALYRGSPPIMYEFISWRIRDSLGVVSITGEPGITWYMTGARIAGDTIGVLTSVKQTDASIPERPFLRQNYPNPFNPTTTIEFTLPKEEFVVIKILDVLGREVARLFSEKGRRGSNVIQWNASDRSSGVYLIQLETHEFVQTRKLLLLR